MQRVSVSTYSSVKACCKASSRSAGALQGLRSRTFSFSPTANAEDQAAPPAEGTPASAFNNRRKSGASPSRANRPHLRSGPPSANSAGRKLYEELSRQRQGNARGEDTAGSSSGVARATRPNTGRRAAARAHQRVDLYLNETGYPQHKEAVQGHEEEELHTSRREHLAPHPPDEASDALSAFVDDSAAHARAPSPRGKRSAGGSSSNRTTISRPGGSGISRTNRTSKELFESASNPSATGRPPFAPGSGARGRPGVVASRPGPNGRRVPGKKPIRNTARPPRRSPNAARAALVKPFDPAPQTVLSKSGYMLAHPLPSRPAESLAYVQKAALVTQWSQQRKSVEKVGKENKGDAAAIMQGDWEKFASSIFAVQPKDEALQASAKGTPRLVKAEAMSRALKAVALNASLPLDKKLEVAKKLDASL